MSRRAGGPWTRLSVAALICLAMAAVAVTVVQRGRGRPAGRVGSPGLRRSAMGAPAAAPTDSAARRQLAAGLVARVDRLTEAERRTLVGLGDDAFVALLPVVQQRLRDYEEEAVSGGFDKARADAYERFSKAIELLREVARKPRTPEMLALLRSTRAAYPMSEVLGWLAAKGDPEQTMPVFLAILQREKPVWGNRLSATGLALSAVSGSDDPRAVRFLIQQLRDSRADPQVRHEAFVNLARTGGEAGVAAVLAAKETARSIPSLADYLRVRELGVKITGKELHQKDGTGPPAELVATGRDHAGVRWGLVTSPILGSDDDLWIARRGPQGWEAPVFTGVTRKQLGKADWCARFVGNSALTRDSDGDGWTDVVEARVGTDPRRRDSDGDGLLDSQEANPLAAPRTLSEEEQVLAAAFEARYRFSHDEGYAVPCLVELPEGVRPMEFGGWGWVTIPLRAGAEPPLGKVVGQGVAVISFSSPNESPGGYPEAAGLIQWNADHTEAKLGLRTYYNGVNATGYNLHLRKVRGGWLVVECKIAWIS